MIFYKAKAIGAVFGDTQTVNNQTTSDNDAGELGEASIKSAALLGIPSPAEPRVVWTAASPSSSFPGRHGS